VRTASFSLLTILCLLLTAAPTMADQILYSNGPINGTAGGWEIDLASGGAVSDSFYNLGRPGAPQPFCNPVVIEDLQIGAWLLPGDSLSSVQMDIGYSPFSGDVGSRLLRPSGSTDLGTNQYGFDIQQIDFTLYMITPPFGEFWLTLSRAQSADQDPIYWDENSGVGCGYFGCPSSAYSTYDDSLGSIPSEAFTVGGEAPEPTSILLFGSGVLALAGVLRRKLNR
jgi:hypothetical protein